MPRKKISEEMPQDAVGILEKEVAEATEEESEIEAQEMADVATMESHAVLNGKSGTDPAAISQVEGDEYGESPPPASLSEEGLEIITVNIEDGAAPDTPDASEVTGHDLYKDADSVPEDHGIVLPVTMTESVAVNKVGPEEKASEEVDPETEVPSEELAHRESPVSDAGGRTSDEERRAFYGLDFNELDRDLTPEQRQEWNSIYASYRGHNAMSGTVVGIDQHRLRVRDRKAGEMSWHRLYCAIVIPFRVRILIPETEMWMKGEERPEFVLRNLPGAKIDFVIIHVDREAGFAVGSRRQALPSRRYYFATRPELNAPGSRTSCEVLVVGPRRCLVSCHGYDIDLTQRDLSYTSVPDLRDVYHSGQTLGCIVKAFDRRENHLSVSVKENAPNPFDGAEFRHPVQSHRQGVIAGKYGGGVFCNLPDGVTVMCNYSFHYDDASFRSGDRVMLIIQRYDERKKQIYGKIVAKC